MILIGQFLILCFKLTNRRSSGVTTIDTILAGEMISASLNCQAEASVAPCFSCIQDENKCLRACLHGGGGPQVGELGNPLRWGNPFVHTISHFNLITFT